MKGLTTFIAALSIVVALTGPAAAQSWSVAIEENAALTNCGSTKNIPVAGATDCDTAKKAAWDLLAKLFQTPGCLKSGCATGTTITPGVSTCKYDPYTRPNGTKANRWQVSWTWTCAPPNSVPCCKCLGETLKVDLSTGQTSPIDQRWRVNNGNAYTTPPYPGWIALAPARWIQPVASPTPSGNVPGNTVYRYTLQFTVPKCTIPMNVRLTGSFAADNSAKAFLDGVPIASCAGPKCFNTPQAPVPLNVPSVAPGPHTLEFQVANISGPSGLIVNAQLQVECKKD
jgi:hypothetical protein